MQLSKKLRYGIPTILLGGALFSSAYQKSSTSRFINHYVDSVLTESQKRLPENSLSGVKMADGLEVKTFATEPMLMNPTDIEVDARGRVWVLEAYNYRPAITGNPTHKEGDRIVILEDKDGDGKADISKVFYQDPSLNAPLGIAVLGNVVIVSQSPYVWKLTDTDGDDKADKKEILFQGMEGEQHDHGMHAFVFGPDGKLYFNFGNEGRQLKDAKGNVVKDQFGKEISPKNYQEGMVFRCNLDGSEVECLGNDFRNNYEVAVDSYGTMWQSDNDDDGNKGVRINYVMEYGSFGYKDEMNHASWNVERTNIESEIPKRHWHLNDPGTVPNLLQTGSGSPTGMIVYEGNLLPKTFQGQMIHCEPGHNVVRSYPVQKSGAGYSAEIVNIMKQEKDQWFRPADVCVAPDGSLIVADWYDPGVGGHQAGDQVRGRVYRIAPPNTPYKVPAMDLSTPAGAVASLQSPNVATRYLAWQALEKFGKSSESELLKVYNSDNQRMKARAFWALCKLVDGKKYTELALSDANPDMRIAGLRAARQLKLDVISYLKNLVKDPDPQIRRECAIALHGSKSAETPELWVTLATQHDGKDRWYLEALGIGASENWDACFAAYLKKVADPTQTEASRDIVWRARTNESIKFLASLATDAKTDLKDRLRYFRAFDFNKGKSKSETLLAMLKGNSAEQNQINKLALSHLDADFVKTSPVAKEALTKLMATLGSKDFVVMQQRYRLSEENNRLMTMIEKGEMTREAGDILVNSPEGLAMMKAVINNPKKEDLAIKVLGSIRGNGGKTSLDLLQSIMFDKTKSMAMRKESTRFLGGSMSGEDLILAHLKEGKIPKDFIPFAVEGVSRAWRRNVRTEAAKYLGNTSGTTKSKLPPMAELVATTGDAKKGIEVFAANCSVCHQVNGEGMDFGPKLSEIGSKLPKEGQYLAIMYPDAGIGFGYEGWELKMKDGSTLTGIISSKTETDLVLKMPGGTVQNLKTSAIKSMKMIKNSMMPTGLMDGMSKDEAVNLVEYLMSLKRK
ncbi:putative membrane-bound dehydrogenase-like protein [Arcicella aurantiaca]|uniref:Putative membrane-bound dehydrogenase-like protein n=1 Tax=Arcicella aurantiaca TaxID=591202 RepID=A0A316E3Z5_9BACT|nr:PVC-type heme-binding CxxCH protein [Arcicella aurantiaca]PWK24378.1 putative membrane-bound dehydrogenase-like protein [Arcicella aurantiaca]